MARARNIKPAIMGNEELAELEPITRLLFIYLWMLADREGRLEDRPKRIAAQALPYDRSADVGAMLDDLHKAGFIVRYEAQGIACIQILAFAKHQTPHVREADSTLPAPNLGTTKVVPSHNLGTTKTMPEHNLGSAEASPRSPDSGFLIPDSGLLIADVESKLSCSAPQAAPSRPAQQAPKKPADKPAEPASGILIPLNDGTDFDVPLANIEEWRAAYPAVDVEQQLREMRVWCLNNPVNRKTRRGIGAFATRWLGREQDKAPRGGGHESYGRSSIFAGAI